MPSKIQLQALLFAQLGKEEQLISLIEQDNDLLECRDKDQNTLLLKALKHHHQSLAEKLFDLHANLNVANASGMTPLHYAIKREYFELARSMLMKPNGVDINAKNNKAESALMILAKSGELETAQCMRSRYPDIGLRNKDGRTPFAIALSHHQFQFADFLIHSRAQINVKDNDGNTPLHVAVQCRDEEAIDFLIAHQACVKISNKDNKTVLDMVATDGDVALTERFRQQDLNDSQNDLSLFQWAGSRGYVELLQALLEAEPTHMASAPVAEVVQEGVVYTHPDVNEPVQCAVSELVSTTDMALIKQDSMGQSDSMAWCESSAYVPSAPILQVQQFESILDKSSTNGETPLCLAVKSNRLNVVKFLINHNACLNATNNQKQTPLMLAVENYFPDIVRELISAGADLNAVNMHGLTAMRIAFNLEAKVCALEFYKHIRRLGHCIDPGGLNEAEARTFDNIVRNNYIDNALIIAVKENNYAEVERLIIENKADVNDADREGKSALYHAVQLGYYSLVELLIRSEADVNSKTPQNDSVLMIAARKGLEDIIKLLIEHDVDLLQTHQDKSTALEMAYHNKKLLVAEIIAKAIVLLGWPLPKFKSNTVLVRDGVVIEHTFPIGLIEAAKSGDQVYADKLLQKGAKINATNQLGETALQVACNHGHVELMKCFVEQGAHTNKTNNEGLGLIHSAAIYDQVESIVFLMNHKVDMKLATTMMCSHKSMMAIHFSAKYGAVNTLRYLLDKDTSQVNIRTHDESTALHLAATFGQIDCCTMLLQNGASLLAVDKSKRVPLENALIEKQEATAAFLYESMIQLGLEIPIPTSLRSKQLLNYIKQSSQAENLLLKFTQENELEKVYQLIKGGAVLSFEDEFSHTALFYALQNRNHDMTTILLQNGADINEKNKDGHTYIMSAAREGDFASIQYFISLGANVVETSETGSIALFHAVMFSPPEVVDYLIGQAPQSIHHRNNQGWSALFFAASQSLDDLVGNLIAMGADPKTKLNNGQTMLMYAASVGKFAMLKSRLLAGDDMDIEDQQGRTALHLAAEENQFEACKYLLISMKNKKILTPKNLKSIKQISNIEKDIQEFKTYCLSHYRKKAPLDAIIKFSKVEYPDSVLNEQDKANIYNQVAGRLILIFAVNVPVIQHIDQELLQLGADSKVTLKVLIELDAIMSDLEVNNDDITAESIELALLKEGRDKNSGLNLALRSNVGMTLFSGGSARRRSESLGKVVAQVSHQALRESVVPVMFTGASPVSLLGEQVTSEEALKNRLLTQLQLNFSQPSQRDFWSSKVRGVSGGMLCEGVRVPNTIFKLKEIIRTDGNSSYSDLLEKLSAKLREEKTTQESRIFSGKVTRSEAVSKLIRDCDNLESIDFSNEANRLRVSSF